MRRSRSQQQQTCRARAGLSRASLRDPPAGGPRRDRPAGALERGRISPVARPAGGKTSQAMSSGIAVEPALRGQEHATGELTAPEAARDQPVPWIRSPRPRRGAGIGEGTSRLLAAVVDGDVSRVRQRAVVRRARLAITRAPALGDCTGRATPPAAPGSATSHPPYGSLGRCLQAVPPASGMAQASSKERPAGLRATMAAGAALNSA